MLKVEKPIWNRSSLGCHAAPIKKGSSISLISANGIHRTERRRVHLLSSFFTRAVFPFVAKEAKIEFFDSLKKSPRCSLGGGAGIISGFSGGKKISEEISSMHPMAIGAIDAIHQESIFPLALFNWSIVTY